MRMLDELSISNLKFALNYATKKIQASHEPYQIKVVGNSMLPTIKDGSYVEIVPIGSHVCKVGDIVCYNNSHYFVLHRIIDIIKNNEKTLYKLKGDNLSHSDYKLVTKEQIVGYYEEKTFPFLNISYSSGDSINVITDLCDVRSFLFNVCPQLMIKKFLCVSNACLNIIIYKERNLYVLEAYVGLEREKIYVESLPELKGELYSIIFHADSIKKLYSDFISLHAGGVAINNTIVCIIGKTGQGKSTILYWLAKNGFSYLGDEIFYIKIDDFDNLPRIAPFYTPVMLRNEVLNLVDDECVIEETLIKKEEGLEKKYAVCIENVLSNITKADVVFVVPRWEKNSITSVEKLNIQRAFEVLMENVQTSVSVNRKIFKKLFILATKFNIYEIKYCDNDDFITNLMTII